MYVENIRTEKQSKLSKVKSGHHSSRASNPRAVLSKIVEQFPFPKQIQQASPLSHSAKMKLARIVDISLTLLPLQKVATRLILQYVP